MKCGRRAPEAFLWIRLIVGAQRVKSIDTGTSISIDFTTEKYEQAAPCDCVNTCTRTSTGRGALPSQRDTPDLEHSRALPQAASVIIAFTRSQIKQLQRARHTHDYPNVGQAPSCSSNAQPSPKERSQALSSNFLHLAS
jgi:hypothetical protein